MVEEKNKLLLIDGNSVTFRAFFALHNSLSRFVNHEGFILTQFMDLRIC